MIVSLDEMKQYLRVDFEDDDASGDVVVLPDHIERRAVVIPDLLVSDFTVEIHVVGQDEQLLDVVAGNLRIQVLGIVSADINHLTDDCTDEEQGRAVHEYVPDDAEKRPHH